jgi:hypothetical protein
MTPVPHIWLFLFNRSSNSVITEGVTLELRFPSGHTMTTTLLVTQLDRTMLAVLGYNWLAHHNLLVDWAMNHLTFWEAMPSLVAVCPLPDPVVPAVHPTAPADPSPVPPISLISALAFQHACKVKENKIFQCTLSEASAQSVGLESDTLESCMASPNGLPLEYADFADVFSESRSNTLVPHWPYDLQIELKDSTALLLGPIYSLSQAELTALHTFIDKNLSTGFIWPSTSEHGTPVLFVKKKDGSLCLCVDFCSLNKVTKKDSYLLPLIGDLLDIPRKANIYTKIDLWHTYHLVQIAEGNKWKTVFHTHYGSFEWLVMPFGLTNAPASFQHFINNIFADLLDVTVIAYLNNILIFSDNPADHKKHIHEVLHWLQKHGLYAWADKCKFGVNTVKYLGYILSPKGLRMDELKIKVIQDWPQPQKVKDTQLFLGFTNFYRWFIFDYSEIIILLTQLTWKDAWWVWMDKCQWAFNWLKIVFTMAPVLTHWEPDTDMYIKTDASNYAIATILSWLCEDSEIWPIAFHSCTLPSTELNYDVHDKELLAIFKAFWMWRHYLEGSQMPVLVFMDHKNLKYFSTMKMLMHQQAWWSEYLSAFNMVIYFWPGCLNEKPNLLTHHWDIYPCNSESGYGSMNLLNCCPIFTAEQLAHSHRATELLDRYLHRTFLLNISALHVDIRDGLWKDPVAAKNMESPPDSRWTIANGFLFLDGKMYVPDDPNLKLWILQMCHDHMLASHPGMNKTTMLVHCDYIWPYMCKYIKDYITSCQACWHGKAPQHKPYGLLQPLLVSWGPWTDIQMDFIEQLPPSCSCATILIVVDQVSKQGIFIPTTNDIDLLELARLFITHVFSKHSIPMHITSDCGAEFVSHFFHSLSAALGVKLHFTSGYC